MNDFVVLVFIVIIGFFVIRFTFKEHRMKKREKKECPHCGSIISLDASVCPKCLRDPGLGGVSFWASTFGELGRLIKLFVIVAVVCVIAYFALSILGLA